MSLRGLFWWCDVVLRRKVAIWCLCRKEFVRLLLFYGACLGGMWLLCAVHHRLHRRLFISGLVDVILVISYRLSLAARPAHESVEDKSGLLLMALNVLLQGLPFVLLLMLTINSVLLTDR